MLVFIVPNRGNNDGEEIIQEISFENQQKNFNWVNKVKAEISFTNEFSQPEDIW